MNALKEDNTITVGILVGIDSDVEHLLNIDVKCKRTLPVRGPARDDGEPITVTSLLQIY
jgi:hypothetical protein